MVNRVAKLLSDPSTALRSADAEDRLLVAYLLVIRYRTPARMAGVSCRTEPISAEESRLILEILAEVDWSRCDPVTQLAPQVAFYRLGLTSEDGWEPQSLQDYHRDFPAAAKKWLREHAGTYRIRRFITDRSTHVVQRRAPATQCSLFP